MKDRERMTELQMQKRKRAMAEKEWLRLYRRHTLAMRLLKTSYGYLPEKDIGGIKARVRRLIASHNRHNKP